MHYLCIVKRLIDFFDCLVKGTIPFGCSGDRVVLLKSIISSRPLVKAVGFQKPTGMRPTDKA